MATATFHMQAYCRCNSSNNSRNDTVDDDMVRKTPNDNHRLNGVTPTETALIETGCYLLNALPSAEVGLSCQDRIEN